MINFALQIWKDILEDIFVDNQRQGLHKKDFFKK